MGFHMTQDPISSDEQVPCIGSKSVGNGVMVTAAIAVRTANTGANGHGIAENVAHTIDQTQGQAVMVTPLALRVQRNADTIVRRLTPLECERLQGYPDGWTDNGQADSARYRQLGNSVAVPCVEWIARRLIAADREVVL